jgi:hypothetical protein
MLATHPLAWVAGDYCLAVATQLPHERWNDRIGAPPDHTPALRCEHSGFFDFRSPLLLYCQGLRLRAIVLRQQLLGCCSSAAAAVRCLRGPRPPRVDGPESRRPLPAGRRRLAGCWLLAAGRRGGRRRPRCVVELAAAGSSGRLWIEAAH